MLAEAALTVTDRRSAPEPDVIDPSLTPMIADSTLYNTIEPPTVATPLVNVNGVDVPKATAPPVPVTVGTVTGLVDEVAPLNVRFFVPVYPRSVFPAASLAVIVKLCAAPAVCVPDPVITRRVAVAAVMLNVDDVVAVNAGLDVAPSV